MLNSNKQYLYIKFMTWFFLLSFFSNQSLKVHKNNVNGRNPSPDDPAASDWGR